MNWFTTCGSKCLIAVRWSHGWQNWMMVLNYSPRFTRNHLSPPLYNFQINYLMPQPWHFPWARRPQCLRSSSPWWRWSRRTRNRSRRPACQCRRTVTCCDISYYGDDFLDSWATCLTKTIQRWLVYNRSCISSINGQGTKHPKLTSNDSRLLAGPTLGPKTMICF